MLFNLYKFFKDYLIFILFFNIYQREIYILILNIKKNIVNKIYK